MKKSVTVFTGMREEVNSMAVWKKTTMRAFMAYLRAAFSGTASLFTASLAGSGSVSGRRLVAVG